MGNKIDLGSLSIEEINCLVEEIEKEKVRRDIDITIAEYVEKVDKLNCKVEMLNNKKAELREQLKDVRYSHYYAKHELDCALDYIKRLEKTKEGI